MDKIYVLLSKNNTKIAKLLLENKRYKLLASIARKRSKRHLAMALANRKIKKYRRYWTSVEHSSFWEKDVPAFDDEKFKNYFRVDRRTFEYLVDQLKAVRKKDTYWRFAIPLRKRIAVALRALASSSEYTTVASLFGIGRSTLGEILVEVCNEIGKSLQKKWIDAYPPTNAKIKEIVEGFDKLGFPQCYGAIDGCHIEVKPPKAEAVDY